MTKDSFLTTSNKLTVNEFVRANRIYYKKGFKRYIYI